MVTEAIETTDQVAAQAMTAEDLYDAKELEIANLTTAFEQAAGDTPTQLMLAAQVLKASEELPALLLAKNEGAIQEAEDMFKMTLVGLVANSPYEELTGIPINTIVFVRAIESETEDSGPLYELAINPKKTTAGRKSSSSSSTARGKAGDSVSRVGPDGNVETSTVKEVVLKYADEKVRALSLFNKSAWSSLFPKVNAVLIAAGENEFTPTTPATEPVQPSANNTTDNETTEG